MSDERTTTPSPRAVRRLGDDISSEVGDLRAALRAALDEADRHEAAGRPDRAAAVLSEQQELLAGVHRRLEERIAAAAVEREAERVLDAVEPAHEPDPAAVASSVPAAEAAPDAAAGRPAGDGMALRLLASVVAGVVGVVLLLVPDSGAMLTVAEWSGVDRGDDTTPVVDPEPGSGTAPDADAADTTSPWSTSSHLGPVAPLVQPGGGGQASPRPGSDDGRDPAQPDDGPRLPGASLSEVTGMLEALDGLEPPVLDTAHAGDDEAGDDEASDEDSTASEGGDDDAARDEDAPSSGLGDVADADGESMSSAR